MLEVIDKGRSTGPHPTPLLFIHGAWQGAWCWDEHFLDYFADNGYRALAVSLRGHGTSPSSKPLNALRIADYVDDVRGVANSLPTMPVLIGQSLGGFVVQKYLESNDAPAGVLLAATWHVQSLVAPHETPSMALDEGHCHREIPVHDRHRRPGA